MRVRQGYSLVWTIAAFTLALSPLAARADTLPTDPPLMRLTFTGTVSASNEQFTPPTITPQTGDPFQLSLTFWCTDPPYEKSVGGFFPDTTQRGAVSEQLLVNGTTYFGGQDFTSFDTYSSLTLDQSNLNFTATDQGYGARGTALVGADFPSAWFADIRNPLSGTPLFFTAAGQFDYYYGLPGIPSLSGSISGGSIELLGASPAGSSPVPEAATLGLILPVLLLLRRRSARPHAHS